MTKLRVSVYREGANQNTSHRLLHRLLSDVSRWVGKVLLGTFWMILAKLRIRHHQSSRPPPAIWQVQNCCWVALAEFFATTDIEASYKGEIKQHSTPDHILIWYFDAVWYFHSLWKKPFAWCLYRWKRNRDAIVTKNCQIWDQSCYPRRLVL